MPQPLFSSTEVRAVAARLVTDELVIVPVRHHSPACAAAVEAAFARHQPSRVLIEGPRSFTDLVPLLCHPDARYPLAVYTWSRPTRRSAGSAGAGGYYPFCDYSPELVAAQLGHQAGIPVGFCDLEVGEQAAAASETVLPGSGSLQREDVYEHSRTLTALASRLGCRDHEDLWELLFEADLAPVDLDEHLARMAAYCLLARGDQTTADLDREGTRQRESEMAWHAARALAARRPGDGPVLMVLGGFHAVALPDLLADPPDRPTFELGPADEGAALVRYGFDRLERLNGYASGMTSPGWHQRIWEERRHGNPPDQARRAAALTVLLDVAELLRGRHHTPVPTPSLAAAQHQLGLLTELRDHPAPLRSDLLDAVTSCLVQGEADVEGRLVRRVTGQVLTGHQVGVVPPGAGTPALVRDTLDRLRALRLDTDAAEPRNLALDLYRNPAHRRTSRALHGLRLLGVPFADHVAGPDFVRGRGLARLQERWSYLWSPVTEGVLAELSLLGATLPEAVETRYGHLLEEATAEGRVPGSIEATSLLAQGAVLGLHDELGPVVTLNRDALAAETSFVAAVIATATLALLEEGREPLEATRLTTLPDLVAAGFSRALYLAADLQGDEQPADDVAHALTRLRELLASPAGQALDPDPFWAVVDHLRRHHDRTLVRGAAAGLASTAGRLQLADLARDVAGHLASSMPPGEAAGFVRGLFATARETVWQESGLVEELDGRLADWEQATFLAALPDLRLAFADLTPRETDRVAELVAALHGGEKPDVSVRRDIDAATIEAHAAVSELVVEALERDGLAGWVTR
ncbi:DUF5682 family protein [Jiangella alba]|uniref:Uncharacterized protein n=1 Tax=Jiangella alba TaxID=561176 RepID=A0A1H5MXF5_9ACTN|nr:DUF5682 family protein [Jiangella alba]SEE93963.1 hypothetical protein SAMN04488561_3512 [Jiangella alba]